MTNSLIKKSGYIFAFFGILFLIYFNLFNKIGLENINNDQLRWQTRTESFFKAFDEGDYASTYQQYHPGVLFMYLIKIGYSSYDFQNGKFATWTDLKGDKFISLNIYLKTVNQIFNLGLIFFSVYLIYLLYGKKVAFVFGIFLINETYFIGILRNLHLDGGNALFIFLTVCLYLTFLKTKRFKFLILTGIFSGLGILLKSTTFLSFFLIGLISLVEIIKNYKQFFKISLNILLILIISISTFSALFPAMWVRPTETLQKVFMEGLLGVGLSGDDNFNHHFNGTTISDPGPNYYLNIIKFRSSNSLILSILIILFLSIYTIYKKVKIEGHSSTYLGYFLISGIIFLLLITYSTKKTDRYISTFFPFILILTSFYLVKLLSIFREKVFYCVILFLTIINFYYNFKIHPYYFAYYNPNLGGIKTAQNYLYINQGGIGYYEVINYFKNFELREGEKVGIYNKDEFNFASNKPIFGLGATDFTTKTYRVPMIQRGRDFLRKSDKIKTIYIGDYPFWEIYKAR